jgi:dephospho-CoA kinase
MKRFVVALTGGIASGKTAVSDRFAALGVDVVDADIAARAVVAPGSDGLAEIVEVFGAEILDAVGTLDRRALRERVFANSAARAQLEAITHPRIRAWMTTELARGHSDYALMVLPLLAESSQYHWVDRVLVVTAPRAVRVARLMARDQVNQDQAIAALNAQVSDDARLRLAHEVIDNAGAAFALDTAVLRLHQRYLQLSGHKL